MITTTDIANILYKELDFGIKRYQKGNIPEGEVSEERIVILPKSQNPSKIWKKGFVEVNFCVPDINGKADLIRLNELERLAAGVENTGVYDGTSYTYSASSPESTLGIEQDTALKCHYVNLKLLFNVLNIQV